MQLEGQRVQELAEELGFNRQELVDTINELDLGFTVNNFMSRLSESEVKELKSALESADEATAEEPVDEAPSEDEEGIGPTVIRRNKEVEETENGAEAEADADADTEPDEEPEEPDVGGVVRRRADDDDEEAEAAQTAEADVDVEAEAEADQEADGDEAPAEDVEAGESQEETAQEAAEAEPSEAEDVEAESADEEQPQVEADEDEAEEASEVEAGGDETQDVEAEADQKDTSEQEAAEQAEEAAESESGESETAAEPEKTTSGAEKKKAQKKEADSKGDEEEEDGAQVLGNISEDLVKERLRAEGKSFDPKKKKKEKEKKKEKKKSKKKSSGKGGGQRRSPHREVVEGKDLYDGDSPKRNRRKKKQRQQKTEITEAAEHKRVIKIEDVISVSDLAHEMGIKAGEVAMTLMESGMQATANTTLDYETAALVAEEYGYKVENVAFDISNFYDTEQDDEELLEARAPVVTVMGHVDHGKTSLLDAVRESQVTEEEAGGITQHIGAYQVSTGDDSGITFLDTPGHEAFTALRARGAKSTDIVVLVVAADDGVMPQTVEAINHAQEAGVPLVVAINKIDKPTSNPDRVKQALTEYELVPEEWGGTTLYVEVSAKEHTNIDELLETIRLQAEIEELQANPNRRAQGNVIEAELDVGRGPVATVLVERGTLHQGDIIVSGQYYGSIRTMVNERGQEVDEAGPSQPVEITGLDGVPEAGEPFFIVNDESDAQRITEHVEEHRRKEEMASRAKEVAAGSIEDLSAMIQQGELKELKVIIKGDVQGSVEALEEAFDKLGNDEVQVQVIHTGVGSVTENDVNLAASSDTAAIIVGFNVRPDRRASEIAEQHGVQILTHSVIYDAIDQVKNILEGLLEPIVEERVLGRVEVRDIFTSNKAGTIAGCYVTDGHVDRNARARLLRDNRVVYETDIASLRRFEEDVREVREGYECGLSLQGYNDIKVGDEIEIFDHEEVSATLS